MPKENIHHFEITTTWTGNTGTGTSHYRAYRRDHELFAQGKSAPIAGSSAPAFRGDPARYNPEDLLVGSLSACHMLWFLHLAAEAGIVVTAYSDPAIGDMVTKPDGSGAFQSVTLRPRVTITDAARIADTPALHERSHHLCFIANSVNFPVVVEPETVAAAV